MFLLKIGALIVALLLTSYQAIGATDSAVPEVTLGDWLTLVSKSNHSLEAQKHRLAATRSQSSIAWAPAQPMVGYFKQKMAMETDYLTISQSLLFPLKYVYAGKAAERASDTASLRLEKITAEKLSAAKLLYYQLFALEQIHDLTQANQSTLREFARVAEVKYASGANGQSDAMRAHVLLTQLELELLQLEAEQTRLKERVGVLSGGKLSAEAFKVSEKLPAPEFVAPPEAVTKWLGSSPDLKMAASMIKEAESQKTLAGLSFAPDFQVSYQDAISGDLEDAEMLMVSMSIPLWFWGPKAKLDQARANLAEQESLKLQTELELKSEIRSLLAEIGVAKKSLEIAETSLIPQAETSFRLAAASYRSGRGSFGDFLDSERDFYQIRKQYYMALQDYVQKLSQLESLVGESLADWPSLAAKKGSAS